MGKGLLVQQTVISCWVATREQHWPEGMLWICMTVVSLNSALFDYYSSDFHVPGNAITLTPHWCLEMGLQD
jgi:hypothetical protein